MHWQYQRYIEGDGCMFLHPCLQMSKIPFLAVTLVVVVALVDFLLCRHVTQYSRTKKVPLQKVIQRKSSKIDTTDSNPFHHKIR